MTSWAGVVTVGALALTLASCTGSDPPPSAEPVPSITSTPSKAPPPPKPPALGACYRMSVAEATQPTSNAKAVPCAKQHTASTIFVGTLDTLVDGHALAVDSDRVQRQLSTVCPRKLGAFLGGSQETRDLSRFEVVWFSPTLAQADRGADWFRCDAIAFATEKDLLPLPTQQRLRGVLARGSALATYGLCGTAQPGEPGFLRVACSRPHSWVAVATIGLAGGAKYPGMAAVRSGGDSDCAEAVRSGAGFVLELTYGWEWPTQQQWASGQRFGFCWAPNDLAG